ncbi:FG-GAP-like repeat-containing protein [Kribbella sp. NPDC056345]|uniref:FG-GAP-like repeat-containing protein n=1 Tax=Kribbella sp. NPDC056345 TaxID=3345789 RepID=UPI0035D9C590
MVAGEGVAQAAPPPAGVGRTVSGRVIDSAGRGVGGVSVHAARTDRYVVTAADGGYTLTGVPSGVAAVVAGKEGLGFASTTLTDSPTADIRLAAEPVVPRNEYPRPDADRRPFTNNAWLSLNGAWSFDFDQKDEGVGQGWFRADRQYGKAIQVPFPYQSLAAFGEQQFATDDLYRGPFDGYAGAVWYRRSFTVPQGFAGQRTRLRIGAANWGARVWLDGNQVFDAPDDGDTELTVDLGALPAGSTHTLAIRSVAPAPVLDSKYPIGRRDVFGPTGGIWQSVWLEPVKAATLDQPRITSELTFNGRTPTSAYATVAVRAIGPASTAKVALRNPAGVEVASGNVALSNGAGQVRIQVPGPMLWDIGKPNLYTADVTLDGDQDGVRATFGLRKVERKKAPQATTGANYYEYIWLNNRPIYVRGTLDQGFNPWGHQTPTGEVTGADFSTGTAADPGRGSIAYDLKAARDNGFNLVRAHVKVFEPAYYHWADKLGLLTWLEIPSSGRGNSLSTASLALHERLTKASLRLHRNHPSIAIWGLFNEGWGAVYTNPNGKLHPLTISYLQRMVPYVRTEAGNALVDDNSACCENGHTSGTDLNDLHQGYAGYDEWKPHLDVFNNDLRPGSTRNFDEGAQNGQPWLMSEMSFSFGQQLEQMSLMRRYPKLAGYIGVELSAIELEQGTPLTYDRQRRGPLFRDHTGALRDVDLVHRDDAISINRDSTVAIKPGAQVSLPISISHFSDEDLSNAQLRWKVAGTGADGRPLDPNVGGTRPATTTRYDVVEAAPVEVTVPETLRSGQIWVWLEAGGKTVAESYVTFVDTTVRAGALDPMSPSASQWSGGTEGQLACGPQELIGYGAGYFEYQVAVPAEAQNGGALEFEASSAESRRPMSSTPWAEVDTATNARKLPTTMTVTVEGAAPYSVVLPDDPSDSLGVASRSFGVYGAGTGNHYGYPVAVPLPAAAVQGKSTITVRVASNGGGLRVFGLHAGDRGLAPRVVAGNGFSAVPASKPTTTDRPGLTFAAATLAADGTGQAIVSIVNDTAAQLTGVEARLALPAGWVVSKPPAVGTIAAAGVAHVAFDIKAPAGATAVPVTATAVWGGGSVQLDATQQPYAVGDISDPAGVGASLSGDARAELLCVEPGGAVRAWHNDNGVGAWGSPDSVVAASGFSEPGRTRFADLDGDGRTEAIQIQPDGKAMAWRNVRAYGDHPWGGASVQVAAIDGSKPERVWFADLNGDRKAEVLVLEPEGKVRAWKNCNGFAPMPWCGDSLIVAEFGTTAAERIHWADLDGDRKVEVMVLQSDGNVRAWHNVEGFAAPPWRGDSVIIAQLGTTPPANVKFADLSGDGRSDIAVVQPDGHLQAWTNGIGWGPMPWRGDSQYLGQNFTDGSRLLFG